MKQDIDFANCSMHYNVMHIKDIFFLNLKKAETKLNSSVDYFSAAVTLTVVHLARHHRT